MKLLKILVLPVLILLMVGITIGIVRGKTLLKSKTAQYLKDTASAACGCDASIENIQVSLLSLSIAAAGVTLTAPSGEILSIKKITVPVSLRNVLDKEIILQTIKLVGVDGRSLGERSIVYKLIEHFTKGGDRKQSGWRVRFTGLTLGEGEFIHALNSRRLVLDGVGVTVRAGTDAVTLVEPVIARLQIQSEQKDNNPLVFTNLGARLAFRTGKVTLSKMSASLKNSFLKASGIMGESTRDSVKASYDFRIDTGSLGISKEINVGLKGRGQVAGTFNEPLVSGSFQSEKKNPLNIEHASQKVLSNGELQGKFELTNTPEGFSAAVNELELKSNAISANLVSPLVISESLLKGTVRVSAKTFRFGDIVLSDIELDTALQGSSDSPKITVAGRFGSIGNGSLSISSLTAKGSYENGNAQFSLYKEIGADRPISLSGSLSPAEKTLASGLSLTVRKYNLRDSATLPGSSPVLVTGEAKLSGLSKLASLAGSGNFRIDVLDPVAPLSFKAKLALQGRVVSGEVVDEAGAKVKARFDSKGNSAVVATLNKTDLAKYILGLECGEVTARLHYDMPGFSVNKGSGQLDVENLRIGCPPNAIGLLKPYAAKIRKGKLLLTPFKIGRRRFFLSVDGQIGLPSSVDLRAQGSLRLADIASVFPEIDDVRGRLNTKLNLTVIDGERDLFGTLELVGAGMLIRDEALELDDVSGKGEIRDGLVTISDVTGKLNGGGLRFTGEIPLANPLLGRANLSLSRASFEPHRNTRFVLSGALSLYLNDAKRPQIDGEIRIESAQFASNLRLRNVVRWFGDIFSQTRAPGLRPRQTPPVDLDVKLVSDGKTFLDTNFAKIELKGHVNAKGVILEPVFAGHLEALSGKFVLRGQTFTLTSASIYFESGLDDAAIEAFGETVLFPGGLDEVLIIAEITGPLYSPEIIFTSDQGLSQEQIVRLLAGSDLFSAQTAVNILTEEVGLAEFAPSKRTTLDRLSVQPRFNSETGQVDLSVIAEKDLTDKLSIVNQSRVSGLDRSSKMQLDYDIAPRTVLAGIANAPVSNRDASFGFDVTYDLIPAKEKFLEIVFEGERVFRRRRLLSTLRLSSNSRISPNGAERLADQLTQFHQDAGYHEAKVEAQCVEMEIYCRTLRFNILAGREYKIRKVELTGLPKDILEGDLKTAKPGESASINMLQAARFSVIKAHREAGYISARVRADYLFLDDGSKQADLQISVRPKQRVELALTGNTFYSNRELLDLIGFETDQRPFGRNSMTLLSRRIREKYLEAGFVNVEVDLKRIKARKTGNLTYSFSVKEGVRPQVGKVYFGGLHAFSEGELRIFLVEQSPTAEELVFRPEYASSVQLKTAERFLRELYLERGFPEAVISSSFNLREGNTTVDINYSITEGNRVAFDTIEIQGLPDKMRPPDFPVKPYSHPKLKRYTVELKRKLRRLGYRSATVSFSEDRDAKEAYYFVESNDPTRIIDVTFRGNTKVASDTLRRYIHLVPGDYWSEERFSDNRRRLLRLGLFSRVEFIPKDGKIDSTHESLVISVIERPLQAASVGTGYDSEYGVHVFGNAFDKSLFRDGRRLGVRGDLYYDLGEEQVSKGLLGFRYQDPFFIGSQYRLTEDFRFQRLDTPSQEFELDRVALSSFLSRSVDGGINYSFGHTLSHEDLGDVSPDAVLGEFDSGAFLLSSVSGSISFDKRDSLLNTRSGYHLLAGTELATEALGSEPNFVSFNTRASYFEPLEVSEQSFGLALNVEGATAFEFGDTDVIPISKRYYLGGRSSVRGFKENSLGPRGEAGSVLGGDLSLLGNVEFRYFPSTRWAVHTFFDAGNVNLKDKPFESLRRSAGIGFRYVSPIGPVGLDVGFPLDKKREEPSSRVHFTIGMSF